jgi:hypothetical protein
MRLNDLNGATSYKNNLNSRRSENDKAYCPNCFHEIDFLDFLHQLSGQPKRINQAYILAVW